METTIVMTYSYHVSHMIYDDQTGEHAAPILKEFGDKDDAISYAQLLRSTAGRWEDIIEIEVWETQNVTYSDGYETRLGPVRTSILEY